MALRLTACVLSLFLAALVFSGCKQGVGEICQIDDDCESGLTCSAVTGLCQESAGDPVVDAAVVVDAPDTPVDAPAVDAPAVDAPASDAGPL